MSELGRCGVCGVNEAIVVAATAIPYSCAYCLECLKRQAQPEPVFLYLLDQAKGDKRKMQNNFVTYYDGEYMSFNDWVKRRLRKLYG